MSDRSAYAVFLHPQAIETLGIAIKPYLVDSPAGAHLQCVEVDSGGALFEMTLIGRNGEGRTVEVELMVPIGMVQLVISVRRDGDFGFGPREAAAAAAATAPVETPAAAGATPAPSTVAPGAAST
jgi:hypothetical protein